MRKQVLRLVVLSVVALVWAAPASARAILKQSEPAPSSVVQRAPKQVVLVFDRAVQPAPGIAVSRGGAGSVVAGKPFVPKGKSNEIAVPLQGSLGQGPYAVSWSVADVRNGELSSGAFVFSIGAGLPALPTTTASQQRSNGVSIGPWLLLVGLLLAAGSAALAVLRVRRWTLASTLAVAGALVVAVVGATLWAVSKPGTSNPAAVAPQPPSSDTVVYAGEDDELAVGLALTPKGGDAVGLRATVLGFTGLVQGLKIGFAVDAHRAPATPCGRGCYAASLPLTGRPRNVAVTVAGKGNPTATLHFTGPTKWPAPQGLDIVRQAERTIVKLHTLVVHSRLASDAHHEVTTVYKMVAPNRLAYRNIGGGQSVLIGTRRWDRGSSRARWVESPQLPAVEQPAPFWTPGIKDAHVLRTDRVDGHPVWVVSFLDPSTPAWFTAWIDRVSYRTLQLEMVATAHFMHDRDGPFNAPISVQPPSS